MLSCWKIKSIFKFDLLESTFKYWKHSAYDDIESSSLIFCYKKILLENLSQIMEKLEDILNTQIN